MVKASVVSALKSRTGQFYIGILPGSFKLVLHDLVLRLAEVLDIPLREHNNLLIAAGLPPIYPDYTLDDEMLRPANCFVRLFGAFCQSISFS